MVTHFQWGGTAALLLLSSLSSHNAFAADPRCTAPPYGDSDVAFKAYANSFGTLAVRIGPAFAASKVLSDVCKAKFGDADRTRFYNLGFTEQDFRTKGVSDLAVQWITALKNMVDKLPDSAFKDAPEEDDSRVYALFLCTQVAQTCQMQGAPRMTVGGPMPGTFYRSFADCQSYAHQISMRQPIEDGRFPIGTDHGMWVRVPQQTC
jgi:hypothetical protein